MVSMYRLYTLYVLYVFYVHVCTGNAAQTLALDSLAKYTMHHLATHVTERGAEEIVHLEPMRHVNLEPFPQEL